MKQALLTCCLILVTFKLPTMSAQTDEQLIDTTRRNRRPNLMDPTFTRNDARREKLPLIGSSSNSKKKRRQKLPLTSTSDDPRREKLPLIDPSSASKDPTKEERRVVLPPPTTQRRVFNNSICKLCKYMYTLSFEEFSKTNNNRTFCVRLLQVQNCISDLRREKIPCGFLQTMFIKGVSRVQWRKNKCKDLDVSADELDSVMNKDDKAKPEVGLNCRYHQPENGNQSRMLHCGMFGDPHVKTFFDVRQTCIVAGDWPLLDNDYMAVEVTNEIVQNTQSTTATATTKVSIVFKEIDLVCGQQKVYEATSQHLPDEFKDGTSATGPKTCQTKIHKHSEKHVSITSCRANSTLIIRRVGKYLTFNVKTPYTIVNKSSGLCFSGCPSSELVDYKSFFENRIQETHNESPMLVSDLEAMELCSKSNLTDFYYDSCVFDLLTTGDKQFSRAARIAMFDAVNMDPKLRLRRENSVVLKVFEELAANSQASSRPSSARRTLPENLFCWLLTVLFCYLHISIPLR